MKTNYKRMKVIAINGSPRREGNTAAALAMVGEQLKQEGIDFEIVHIGHKLIHGCIGCYVCAKNKDEKCVFGDDLVNDTVQKMKEADGIILGSPVYFSGIAGTMKSFLDRAFVLSGTNGGLFRGKVGASVVAVRRSGGTMTLNSLNHYISYCEMTVVASNYWTIIHGNAPGEVAQDAEGVQIMRVLGKNMAHHLRLKNIGIESQYDKESKLYTNFVREDLSF